MILKYRNEYGNFGIISKVEKTIFCNKSNSITVYFDDRFEKTIPVSFIISITN